MSGLAFDYQRTLTRQPQPLLTGLDSRLHTFVGSQVGGPGSAGGFKAMAREVDERAGEWRDLADNRLRGRLVELGYEGRVVLTAGIPTGLRGPTNTVNVIDL